MPVPENVLRANIRATVSTNEEVVHTLHFRRVNTLTEPDVTPQEVADKVVAEWTTLLTSAVGTGIVLGQRLRSDIVYKTVDVYELGPTGLANSQAQATFGVTAKGSSASIALPPEVALVASLRTGLPGRSKRGRLYLGGFTVNDVLAQGVVSVPLQTAISAGLARFGAAMKMDPGGTVDRLNWSVLSRTLGETNRITEVRTGTLWDVQRRRQNGMIETFTDADITY